MFSIKKKNDKVVITKSTIPTSPSTGRLLAKSLLDNIKLQSELEQVKCESQTPLVGSPITPDVVRAHTQPQTIETQMEQTRIMARVSTMNDLDKKAKLSQEGYNPNSRFMIRNNNVPLSPTGAPNQKVMDQITEENVVLMAHGKKPFLTYTEWTDVGDSSNLGNPDVQWKKYEEPVLASPSIPVYIAAQNYFLMWDADKCYFLVANMAVPSILKRSASENISGLTVDNSSILMSKGVGKYRDMSRAEYNDIVANQPPLADLFRVYIQFCNNDKVLMDTSKATTIWSKE